MVFVVISHLSREAYQDNGGVWGRWVFRAGGVGRALAKLASRPGPEKGEF